MSEARTHPTTVGAEKTVGELFKLDIRALPLSDFGAWRLSCVLS